RPGRSDASSRVAVSSGAAALPASVLMSGGFTAWSRPKRRPGRRSAQPRRPGGGRRRGRRVRFRRSLLRRGIRRRLGRRRGGGVALARVALGPVHEAVDLLVVAGEALLGHVTPAV